MKWGCLGLLALLGGVSATSAGELRRTPVVVAVEKVSPAVVNVATEQMVARREDPSSAADPFFEEYFKNLDEPRLTERFERASLGSGVIVDARGHVVTNAHVVERATRIKVILADKREFDADVVGQDPTSDIAVLHIRTTEKLPFAVLGTSSDLQIGETLIAIGNPFGLSHTVTCGVLSAKARSVRSGKRQYGDFLQTDASINPGNSGGPLLNLDGEVVGIATAIYQSGQGIGFAIPIDRARRVVESLVSHGTPQSAWIGLEAKTADAAILASLRLAAGAGLVVTHVVAEGPADDAKILPGDLVLAVSGAPVGSPEALDDALARAKVESAVKLDVIRDGRRLSVPVRPLESGSPRLRRIASRLIGFEVGAREPGLPGLVLTQVNPESRAAARGFAVGDVLYEMDGVKLDSMAAYGRAFYGALSKRSAMILVQHGESAYYVPLGLE